MTDEALVEGLKAVAHPLRLRVLKALRGVELNVGEIETATGIGQPALSQQLGVLRKAGLVDTRKEAKLVYYRLEHDRLGAAAEALADLIAGSAAVPKSARKPAPGVANFARLS